MRQKPARHGKPGRREPAEVHGFAAHERQGSGTQFTEIHDETFRRPALCRTHFPAPTSGPRIQLWPLAGSGAAGAAPLPRGLQSYSPASASPLSSHITSRLRKTGGPSHRAAIFAANSEVSGRLEFSMADS